MASIDETSEPEGAALLQQVWERLQADPRWEASSAQPGLVQEGRKFGAPSLFRPRLGQGAFRVLVTEAYERRCALTVRPNLTIDVSSRIASEYANGKIYYALQDRPLAVVPVPPLERPSPDFLKWHNQQVFRP